MKLHLLLFGKEWCQVLDIETLMKELTNVSLEKQEILEREAEIKSQLFQAMKKQKVSKLETSRIVVNYVDAFIRNAVDSEKLKREFPDAAAKCMKSTPIDAYVKVRVIGG